VPPTHADEPGQTVPHAPQFFGLVFTSTQVPPQHIEPLHSEQPPLPRSWFPGGGGFASAQPATKAAAISA
jgi:hypothetical protein